MVVLVLVARATVHRRGGGSSDNSRNDGTTSYVSN